MARPHHPDIDNQPKGQEEEGERGVTGDLVRGGTPRGRARAISVATTGETGRKGEDIGEGREEEEGGGPPRGLAI